MNILPIYHSLKDHQSVFHMLYYRSQEALLKVKICSNLTLTHLIFRTNSMANKFRQNIQQLNY